MKLAVIALFIIGFAGMAVFGAYVMSISEHGHTGCIAETVNGGDCPAGSNLSALVNFHLGAAKSFSNAVFLALVLAIGLIALKIFSQPSFSFAISRRRIFDFSLADNKIAFIRWLARHENSPAVI